MGLWDSDRKGKVGYRSAFVKDLAKKMGADYYYGISEVKKIFPIYGYDMEDSNVIQGKKDGYDYCFIEYCYIDHAKDRYLRWRSVLHLKLKNKNLPSFHVAPKGTAFSKSVFEILHFVPYLIISIIFMFLLFNHSKNASGFGFDSICFLLITLLLLLVGILGIYLSLKKYKKIFKQGKYRIQNKEFKKKYYIKSDEDPKEIRNIFTEEVCTKIVNCFSDVDLDISAGFTSVTFDSDSQLTYSTCKGYLDDLIYKVNIFEEAADSLK